MLIQFSTLNMLVGFGALLLEIGVVILIGLYLFRKRSEVAEEILGLFKRFTLWIGLLLSLSGVVVSLYYSEVLGFPPCGLCWTIRIFLYPLAVLFALALYKRDKGIGDYVIALSVPGALVALYQHYLQMGGTEIVNCPTVSTGADCAERFLFEFGHITFPWVAFVLFVFLIVSMIIMRRG